VAATLEVTGSKATSSCYLVDCRVPVSYFFSSQWFTTRCSVLHYDAPLPDMIIAVFVACVEFEGGVPAVVRTDTSGPPPRQSAAIVGHKGAERQVRSAAVCSG
jgi:hypothetical protein